MDGRLTDEAFLDLLDTPTPANDVEEGEVEDVGPAQKETVDVDSDEIFANEQMNETAKAAVRAHVVEAKYIVPVSLLRSTILRLTCSECGAATKVGTVDEKKIMAGILFVYKCANGHRQTWASTPYYGGRSFVGQVLALAIFLSGLTYHHVAQAASFLGLCIPAASSYFRLQVMYYRGITQFFAEKQKEVQLNNSGVVAMDTRFDSPGFCASKSTTIAMDIETGAIVAAKFGDNRETNYHSAAMEPTNVRSLLDDLAKMGIKEIVTDASTTVKSILAEPSNEDRFTHSMDVWHKGKRIAEMITQAMKGRKDLRVLKAWIKPIVNHFWWCCEQSKGDQDQLDARWTSLLWHVQDIHTWSLGQCYHSLNEYSLKEPTLEEGSPAFEALSGMLSSQQFLGSLVYYKNSRHTGKVENFFSHTLLHYCPKRLSFSFSGYAVRNMLAILEHNCNLNREPLLTANGTPYFQAQLSRRTKQWVLYEKLQAKDFSYIPDLMMHCLEDTYGIPLVQYAKLRPAIESDLAEIRNAKRPNPGVAAILEEKRNRGSNNSQ